MPPPKNIRRHPRIPHSSPIRISWEHEGQSRFAMGKCIDISEDGLRIEVPQAVPRGASIQLSADKLKLVGAATVKHSGRRGGNFLLGLELSQALLRKTIAGIEGRPVVTVDIENFNRFHQKI